MLWCLQDSGCKIDAEEHKSKHAGHFIGGKSNVHKGGRLMNWGLFRV